MTLVFQKDIMHGKNEAPLSDEKMNFTCAECLERKRSAWVSLFISSTVNSEAMLRCYQACRACIKTCPITYTPLTALRLEFRRSI